MQHGSEIDSGNERKMMRFKIYLCVCLLLLKTPILLLKFLCKWQIQEMEVTDIFCLCTWVDVGFSMTNSYVEQNKGTFQPKMSGAPFCH